MRTRVRQRAAERVHAPRSAGDLQPRRHLRPIQLQHLPWPITGPAPAAPPRDCSSHSRRRTRSTDQRSSVRSPLVSLEPKRVVHLPLPDSYESSNPLGALFENRKRGDKDLPIPSLSLSGFSATQETSASAHPADPPTVPLGVTSAVDNAYRSNPEAAAQAASGQFDLGNRALS
jgi:hypothetical protein